MLGGIDPVQLRDYVIKPAIEAIGLGGEAAEELMLGTAIQESGGGRYLAQLGGPALGPWQMEPATDRDLWTNFIPAKRSLAMTLHSLRMGIIDPVEQLKGNLYYACAMARVLYFRAPQPLPTPGDLASQGAYWKQHYNTPQGAGTIEEYIANWRRAVPPENAQ